MVSFLYGLLSFLFMVTQIFSDHTWIDQEGREIRIVTARSIDAIDLTQGKDVLVRGFMLGYEDVPLTDLNPAFRSIGDVRRFYEDYFDSELEHYKHGELIWIQAFEGDRLLGWATFQEEDRDALYMNLLVVAPEGQGRGVGKQLTFSILSPDLYPETKEIRLLVRKVNESGRQFYENIGFSPFDYNRPDNFVDLSLLTGLRWQSILCPVES